jgi:hypothetical protein
VEAPLDVVTVDNSEFFRIWSKTTNNPDFVDLVQSEHAKRVIMFSVQKPVNIVGGYRGVHIDSFSRAQAFRHTGAGLQGSPVNASPPNSRCGQILLELLAYHYPFPLAPPYLEYSPHQLVMHIDEVSIAAVPTGLKTINSNNAPDWFKHCGCPLIAHLPSNWL